jgi:Secretion system C-terminal sorting domain/PKD domain
MLPKRRTFVHPNVTHTVTIGDIMYTCSRQIQIDCNTGCDDRVFSYEVNGCSVTFYGAAPSGQFWDFGDGNISSLINPTHTYTTNGDYTVSYTVIGGEVCQKTIRVACGSTQTCCTAAFSGEVKRECSKLVLSLNAECTGNGTHQWIITPNVPNACMTLANFFQGVPMQGMIQVTNINTCIVNGLIVTHRFICPNGSVQIVTQTLPIQDQGIFIGKDGATTPLTDYNCVLPGALYNGACTVYSSGIVTLDKDFTFSSANVRVEPGLSGFDVTKNFTLDQNTVVSGNSEPDCNCLWRGINVYGAVTMTTDTDASIQDALYAIRASYKNTLNIKKTLFAKNFVGIRGTDGAFKLPSFEENKFDGLGPLKDICSLEPLNDLVSVAVGAGWCEAPVQYNPVKGFAGIYLKEAGNITLLPLAFSKQNLFYDLAVGIHAKDTELQIRQNSRFKDIIPIPTGFGSIGGIAIKYSDSDIKGANGFLMSGNGKSFGGVPDFDNCTFGVYLTSSVSADVNSGTRIDVEECRFLKAQIGVLMENLCSANGIFTGNKNSLPWGGVWNNYIEVNPTTGDQFVVLFTVPKAGIAVADWNPSQSAPEIWKNTIDVNQDNICGASYGIRVWGLSFLSPLLNQVDINKNRINLNAGFSSINVITYDGAWIHDNSNAAYPGAGIFLNYQHFEQIQDCGSLVDFSSGISLIAGRKNLVGCNDVLSTLPGNHDLRVAGQTDGTYVQNNLSGGRFGAIMSGGFSTERFACNTMSGYAENGLYLFGNTNLGQQGTPFTMTHGNKWVNSNPAIKDAFIQAPTNPAASPFFVTTRPSENPTTNIGLWFFANVPNTVDPTCYYECPITAPQAFESELTFGDTTIAERTLTYQSYPEANQWINERNLLEKLTLSPELSANSTLMADFMDNHEHTAMGKLVTVNSAMSSLFVLSEAQLSALASITQTTKGLLSQLFYLDSIAGTAFTTPLLEVNLAQRDRLNVLLQGVQKEADSIAHEISLQIQQQGAIALTTLKSIAPTNAFEFNEKYVLSTYLNTLVSGNQPSSGAEDSLYNIGRECLLVSGPCVYNARSLYGKITGIELPDVDCPILENRSNRNIHPSGAKSSDILIYPNPANEVLTIRLLASTEPGTCRVKISNILGEVLLDTGIQGRDNEVSIKHFPSGAYFVQIVQNGTQVLTTPVFIQH